MKNIWDNTKMTTPPTPLETAPGVAPQEATPGVASAFQAPSGLSVIQQTTFAQNAVKQLHESDFTIENKELIGLRYDDCTLVLFYGENTESLQLVQIWATVAQQVAGPVFAACNLLVERGVASALTRLKADGSNPLHWASFRGFPFILVYRGGWPVAFYNGPRETQALIDYALTLACQASYYEPIQEAGGMQAEGSLSMG